MNRLLLTISATLLCSQLIYAQDISTKNIMLADVEFEYLGAFRISYEVYGDSRIAYSTGAFAVTSGDTSFYVAGNQGKKGIGQFEIPKLNQCKKISECPVAQPMQGFSLFLDRLKNDYGLNYITGMELIEGELFVNALEYYDADANATDTTFIIRQPEQLRYSQVDGFFKMSGKNHSAGWMSPLPSKVRLVFGASYLVGYASNVPINSRLSQGPSLYIGNIDGFAGITESKGLIPLTKKMDFDLKKPMAKDKYNKSGQNKMWTIVSNAVYGFIPTGSKYYITIGNSGGHNSKVGYKIQRGTGKRCHGPCAFDEDDYYNYYWAFPLDELLKGKRNPYDYRPSYHTKIQTVLTTTKGYRPIIGADFNPNSNKLYILIGNVDDSQTKWEHLPIMLVYKMTSG